VPVENTKYASREQSRAFLEGARAGFGEIFLEGLEPGKNAPAPQHCFKGTQKAKVLYLAGEKRANLFIIVYHNIWWSRYLEHLSACKQHRSRNV